MNGKITELYTDEDLDSLRCKIRRLNVFHGLLAAGALALCLVLIALTRTANAARMEILVIAVSTLAGWVVLYGQLLIALPCRRELRHALMLRSEEREKICGVVSVTEERIVIRGSITARRVEIRSGDEVRRALVCESRAGALAGLGEAVLYTAHNYAAAYEGTE